jgi:hypothetical protein
MKHRLFPIILTLSLILPHLNAQLYDSSPSTVQILPECIWGQAAGGGEWRTEVQIYARNTGTVVKVRNMVGMYSSGPFTIWTSPGPHNTYKNSNIMQVMDSLDSSFNYYNHLYSLYFVSEGGPIQVTARIYHTSGYAKTYQGINPVKDGNVGKVGQPLMIYNLSQSPTTRSVCRIVEHIYQPIEVECRLMDDSNNIIGNSFTQVIPEWRNWTFDPFEEAGVPNGTYNNCFLFIKPLEWNGYKGKIVSIGSTADNNTNDPASHRAMQYNY